jgi:hypothetical protein
MNSRQKLNFELEGTGLSEAPCGDPPRRRLKIIERITQNDLYSLQNLNIHLILQFYYYIL